MNPKCKDSKIKWRRQTQGLKPTNKDVVYILVQDPTGKPAFHVILPQYPDKQAHALPGFLFEFATLHK